MILTDAHIGPYTALVKNDDFDEDHIIIEIHSGRFIWSNTLIDKVTIENGKFYDLNDFLASYLAVRRKERDHLISMIYQRCGSGLFTSLDIAPFNVGTGFISELEKHGFVIANGIAPDNHVQFKLTPYAIEIGQRGEKL